MPLRVHVENEGVAVKCTPPSFVLVGEIYSE